jgi:D-alanine-D-alanine ligase
VKPAHEGSSLGLTKVKTVDELPTAYAKAASLDTKVIAETCIIGDELTCPLVGEGQSAEALPVIRIVPPDANYDFHNKYFSNDTQYLCPVDLDDTLLDQINQLVLRGFEVVGAQGWGRMDLMLDENNQPWLIELNTVPGMTEKSLVPKAARVAGLTFEQLVVEILASSVRG